VDDLDTTNPPAHDDADPDAERRNSLPALISDMESPLAQVHGLAEALFKAADGSEGLEALSNAIRRAADDVKELWERAFHLAHAKQEAAPKWGEIEVIKQLFAGAKVTFDADENGSSVIIKNASLVLMSADLKQVAPLLALLKLQTKS
jgi:hypothetical protein